MKMYSLENSVARQREKNKYITKVGGESVKSLRCAKLLRGCEEKRGLSKILSFVIVS